MSTQSNGRFQVTFFNKLANRRGIALDGLSREEAEACAAQLSDKSKPFFYLPDVQIEEDLTRVEGAQS